jgi:hypothetical protein
VGKIFDLTAGIVFDGVLGKVAGQSFARATSTRGKYILLFHLNFFPHDTNLKIYSQSKDGEEKTGLQLKERERKRENQVVGEEKRMEFQRKEEEETLGNQLKVKEQNANVQIEEEKERANLAELER